MQLEEEHIKEMTKKEEELKRRKLVQEKLELERDAERERLKMTKLERIREVKLLHSCSFCTYVTFAFLGLFEAQVNPCKRDSNSGNPPLPTPGKKAKGKGRPEH